MEPLVDTNMTASMTKIESRHGKIKSQNVHFWWVGQWGQGKPSGLEPFVGCCHISMYMDLKFAFLCFVFPFCLCWQKKMEVLWYPARQRRYALTSALPTVLCPRGSNNWVGNVLVLVAFCQCIRDGINIKKCGMYIPWVRHFLTTSALITFWPWPCDPWWLIYVIVCLSTDFPMTFDLCKLKCSCLFFPGSSTFRWHQWSPAYDLDPLTPKWRVLSGISVSQTHFVLVSSFCLQIPPPPH